MSKIAPVQRVEIGAKTIMEIYKDHHTFISKLQVYTRNLHNYISQADKYLKKGVDFQAVMHIPLKSIYYIESKDRKIDYQSLAVHDNFFFVS